MDSEKKFRIAFLGSDEIALPFLLNLERSVPQCEISAVLTQPDRPSGRGRKLTPNPIKQWAMDHSIDHRDPISPGMEEITWLESLRIDLLLVMAYGHILRQPFLEVAQKGCFNLHASILPYYRGASPIESALAMGEKQTGVTTFFIDDKIDTGSILLQKKVDISPDETVGMLHDKLMHFGAALITKTIDGIASHTLTAVPQSTSSPVKTAYKLNRNNCKINWNESVVKLFNKIRGLNPFPAAWCYLDHGTTKEMIKIFKCRYSITDHNLEVGNITMNQDHIKVAAKDGFIEIYELQLPGKRKMEVKSLLNGYQFKSQQKLS